MIETYDDLARIHPGAAARPWLGGLIAGNTGTGKSRLAFERGLSVGAVFVRAHKFLIVARAVMLGGPVEPDRDAAHRRIFACRHLILDDLGTRRPSDFVYDAIYTLLDERWHAGHSTLITSNIPLSQIAELYDERVASRIAAFGPVRTLTGDDRRLPRPQIADAGRFKRA